MNASEQDQRKIDVAIRAAIERAGRETTFPPPPKIPFGIEWKFEPAATLGGMEYILQRPDIGLVRFNVPSLDPCLIVFECGQEEIGEVWDQSAFALVERVLAAFFSSSPEADYSRAGEIGVPIHCPTHFQIMAQPPPSLHLCSKRALEIILSEPPQRIEPGIITGQPDKQVIGFRTNQFAINVHNSGHYHFPLGVRDPGDTRSCSFSCPRCNAMVRRTKRPIKAQIGGAYGTIFSCQCVEIIIPAHEAKTMIIDAAAWQFCLDKAREASEREQKFAS